MLVVRAELRAQRLCQPHMKRGQLVGGHSEIAVSFAPTIGPPRGMKPAKSGIARRRTRVKEAAVLAERNHRAQLFF